MSKVVLITGCSTGIGRDLAQRLTRSGYTVVATARKVETLNDLECTLKLPLDVTHLDSVTNAVAETLKQFGCIDVLVNNAGYAIRGVLEETPLEQAQQVFDVNVFGVLRMIRAVVPHMREQKAGCIINISSIAGKLSTPVNGIYSASKFALEALSDALRIEVVPFGVQVVSIEPGAIKTQFDETAQSHAHDVVSNKASPYFPLYQRSDQSAESMRQNEPGPEAVSQIIQMAMEEVKPKARYFAAFPFSGRLVLHLRDFVWDVALAQMFKVK